jgi:hypothetical protein
MPLTLKTRTIIDGGEVVMTATTKREVSVAALALRGRGENMMSYQIEHVLSFTGKIPPTPEVIGPVAEGVRVTFYNVGGEFSGPRLHGHLREGAGGDWYTVRRDGMGLLNVRTTFETHDGALILVTYHGFAELGEDGYETFLERGTPPVVNLRISPRFLTSHPSYMWLNRLHCFGIGLYDAATGAAHYDVYALPMK